MFTLSLIVGSCLLTADTGTCSDGVTRYSYDSTDGLCKPFIYSGCGGNNNNFNSQADCESNCAAQYEQGIIKI